MKHMSLNYRRGNLLVLAFLAWVICAVLLRPVTATAQLLYSFEGGLDGFTLLENGIAINQSSIGATEGTYSMAVETSPTWTWDARVNHYPGDAIYNTFNSIAAQLEDYTLDFDITLTEESWANVTIDNNTYFYVNLAVNSLGGWKQLGGAFRCGGGATGTFPTSVMMSSLPVATDSTYYQLNLGSSSNFTPGPLEEGVVYYIDNIRFTRIPVYTEELVFSWETPDDPGTPEIDERFEGWVETPDGKHVHSITTTGATHGNYALQIDRSGTSGFTWGSQVEITGGAGTPEQEIIDDLVARVESADRIAFDVTWNDPFPASPTWLQFSMSISDSGQWFQTSQVSLSPAVPTQETTLTVEYAIADFMTYGENPQSLADLGFTDGTTFLQLAISTNTDDGGVYQIDNIRLKYEVLPLAADFNGDGTTDGLDLPFWSAGFGMTTGATLGDGDADGDRDVDGNDFLIWQTEFSDPGYDLANMAVPEPGTMFLAALLVIPCLAGTYRKKRR